VSLYAVWEKSGGAADNGTIGAYRGAFPFVQMAKVQLRGCVSIAPGIKIRVNHPWMGATSLPGR